MTVLFAIIGLVVGVIQFFLLSLITATVLSDNKKTKLIVPLVIKLAVYAISVLCIIFLFVDYVLPFAVGFGVGIIGFAAINLIRKSSAAAKKE